jgi:hypothetical protein
MKRGILFTMNLYDKQTEGYDYSSEAETDQSALHRALQSYYFFFLLFFTDSHHFLPEKQ